MMSLAESSRRDVRAAGRAGDDAHRGGRRRWPPAAQIEANRKNAQQSTGPKSGTDRTRFNGLKHGLCAEQVVLPGEDPAAFEAEKQAWFDDWKPATHTRAVLVERAAVASWKLRRATRVEAVRLYEAAADAAHEFDLAQKERIEAGCTCWRASPARPWRGSGATPPGSTASSGSGRSWPRPPRGPAGWHSRPDHHDRLLNLLGHPAGSDPQDLEVARTSRDLLAGADPAAAAALRAFCAGQDRRAPPGAGRPTGSRR